MAEAGKAFPPLPLKGRGIHGLKPTCGEDALCFAALQLVRVEFDPPETQRSSYDANHRGGIEFAHYTGVSVRYKLPRRPL